MAGCSQWILPEEPKPILKFAKRALRDFPWTIPVDIFALAQDWSTVDFVDWDYDCDALVHGLTSERPGIMLRTLDSVFDRRLRMTLGHELGHIIVPWHVGTITCDGSNEILETASFPASPFRLRTQESEATEFSSAVLMPFEALFRDAEEQPLGQFFAGLDRYQTSAHATVIRLTEILRPGFIFRGRYTGTLTEHYSRGTQRLPSSIDRARQLREAAYESGQFSIGSKVVYWYRLAQMDDFQPVVDDRTTTQILRDVVAQVWANRTPEEEKLAQRINGVVSGALGKIRFSSEEEALSHVRQWTVHHETIPQWVLESEDFDLYLRRKSEERLVALRASGAI